jgi:hypothetical protein
LPVKLLLLFGAAGTAFDELHAAIFCATGARTIAELSAGSFFEFGFSHHSYFLFLEYFRQTLRPFERPNWMHFLPFLAPTFLRAILLAFR